jgi:hypothetical protein
MSLWAKALGRDGRFGVWWHGIEGFACSWRLLRDKLFKCNAYNYGKCQTLFLSMLQCAFPPFNVVSIATILFCSQKMQNKKTQNHT